MATTANQYQPDYAVLPGWVLEERLQAAGLSQAEFARRCGRSPKMISEIISGKAPIEPDTALQFEKVLGLDAGIWLGIEMDYRLHEARQLEAKDAGSSLQWAKGFPIKELVKRGHVEQPVSDQDLVSKLLAFFRVASVDAWKAKYGCRGAAYRHSPSFKSEGPTLATWLRLGEVQAEQQSCSHYDESAFKKALLDIRGLTRLPIAEGWPEAQSLCNRSGVVLALIKPLPKMALSGAAWWFSPRTAVIQLSARHKTDDHFWFTFFHEAAHILLHSKKNIFIDDSNSADLDWEKEANQWASNKLIGSAHWAKFIETRPYRKDDVVTFAERQGIAAGIVVGRLQHEGRLPWNRLNSLKTKFVWPIGYIS
ncbi:MAG: HigA family addiction module antitoxin [Geminicoccaceae bacterium]